MLPSLGSITSSLKSFASNLIRPNKAAPVPAEPAPRELTPPPREQTPPPVQGPGPHTVRLIPSPGPNNIPRSRSAADLLEGVPLPTPTLAKIVTDLAETDKIINGETSPVGARVSFGFGSAGYDDEQNPDVSMASINPTTPITTAIKAKDDGGDFPSAADKSPSFVFGSPRHSVSNTQFGDAAAAVLREMNARMGITSPAQAVSIEQLQGVMANAGKPTGAPVKVDNKPDVRFKAKHEREFAKYV
jgi:hypothetical protein